MSEKSWSLGYAVYSGICATVAFFVLYGLGASKISQNVELFKLYAGLLLGLSILNVIGELINKRIFKVHEPKDSIILRTFPKFQNPLTLILGGLLISFFFGTLLILKSQIAGIVPQTSIPLWSSSSGVFASKIGQWLMYIIPASPAETNMFLNIVMGLIIFNLLRIVISQIGSFKLIENNMFVFVGFGIFISLIGAFLGGFMHNTVYGSDAKAILTVRLFWFLMTFLWWITQSILASEALHIGNNAVAGLVAVFLSTGLITFISAIATIIIFILFILSFSETSRKIIKQALTRANS